MNKEQFESVCCIICDGNDLDKISDSGQFNLPTHVCICKNCGLSFLSPRWTEKKYLDFYRNDYDKLYRPNVITKQYTTSPEKDPYSYYPILKRLQDQDLITEKTKKVLDIGSGSGQKLALFKNVEPIEELYAIEPSKNCFPQLESRNIKVITDDIHTDWVQQYKNTFDLIIMRHVLEHFMNPLEVLKKLRETLSPNGIIYIAVPNSLILENRQLFKSYFRVVHTYYFNKLSMKNLVHKAGFEILEMKEGDDLHGLELFLMIKSSEEQLPVEINTDYYNIQLAAFNKKIKEENSVPFIVHQFLEEQWRKITKIKKSIFPKPLR